MNDTILPRLYSSDIFFNILEIFFNILDIFFDVLDIYFNITYIAFYLKEGVGGHDLMLGLLPKNYQTWHLSFFRL